MRKLIAKHKTLINWYQKKLKLSDYQLLWLVFLKGVLITIIFFKIFLILKKLFQEWNFHMIWLYLIIDFLIS